MRVQLCPACRSKDISLFLGGYVGKVYSCASCGYVGPVVIEVDSAEVLEMLEEASENFIDEAYKKSRLEDLEKSPFCRKGRRGRFK